MYWLKRDRQLIQIIQNLLPSTDRSMNRILLVLLILVSLSVMAQSFRLNSPFIKVQEQLKEFCNFTHFEYQTNVSLNRNGELNRTFTKINEKINVLNNVSYKVNDSVSYLIYDAKPIFYYRDSRQKTQFVGYDAMIVEKGYAEVTINFKWQKIGVDAKSGSATVFGISDQIVFAKSIIFDDDQFHFNLLDYLEITYDNPLSLSSVDPSISVYEQHDLMGLVNKIRNETTLKYQLVNDISLIYSYYLRLNIKQENAFVNKKFFYKWTSPVPSKTDLVINLTRRPVSMVIGRKDLSYSYETIIDGFTQSKCGPQPSTLPPNPKIYGGGQEFISYTFYQNVIRYAAQQKVFDTILNKAQWESRMFDFTVWDLYDMIPYILKKFKPSTEVIGDCKASTTNVRVYKGVDEAFRVLLQLNCQLSIEEEKIVDFLIKLELEVKGRPQADYIDFQLKSHSEDITYNAAQGYEFQNKPLADSIIRQGLNKLYEGKLFGSGWPLQPRRDYPQFLTDLSNTFVYDPTYVD